jgi:hypothetical protein
MSYSIRNLIVFTSLVTMQVLFVGCAPSEPVQAHSFFSGQALLDANGNGQIDADDTPVENATLIVALQGGIEFGGNTDSSGNAFVTVPSMVEYPVTIRMEAPVGSSLILIEPVKVILSEVAGETTKFLFSSK